MLSVSFVKIFWTNINEIFDIFSTPYRVNGVNADESLGVFWQNSIHHLGLSENLGSTLYHQDQCQSHRGQRTRPEMPFSDYNNLNSDFNRHNNVTISVSTVYDKFLSVHNSSHIQYIAYGDSNRDSDWSRCFGTWVSLVLVTIYT